MIKKFLLLFTACLLALGAPRLDAQNPPTLSLQQAEQIALKNHPQIFAAQYNALASNQMVREARSAYFPTAYGSVTGVNGDRNTRLGAGFLSMSRLLSHEGQGITVDQLITDSGRTPNLVASSRLAAKAQQQNAQATRYDVLLALNRAYFEVLRAQALVKVAKETVAERNVVYEQVSAMVQNKLKSDLDLSFAKVNLGQAQLLEIKTEDNLKAAQAELTRALGLQTAPQYKLLPQSLPPVPPSTSDPLVAEAMQNRPEVASLRFGRESAYKFEHAERDLSYPTLVVEGDAGYIPLIAQLTLPHMIPDHYEAAAFNLEVPIFNGHLFAARRAAALMKARAADEKLRNMEERITRDVRSAWADASTGYQRISVADEVLSQSKLAMALAQGRYNLGLASIVALTQAQLNETEAGIQDVNARYDFQDEHAMLEYEIGILR